MRIPVSLSLTRSRIAAVCVGALAATGVALVGAGGASADGYPGQDEINAAREAAASQASTVSELDAAVASLEDALHDAEAAQLLAADKYAQAQGDLEAAQANLVTANRRADEADAALAEAQSKLAVVAQAAYRDGGDMGQVGAVVNANGFEDAINSSEAMNRASDEMATLVQRVEAAQLVADTMRKAANDAATAAADAKIAAADAYDDATAAADAAEQAVKDADEVRDDAVNTLAELRGTTVALENARQDGLAAERDKKRRDDAKAAQEEVEKENGGSSNSGGSSNPGGNSNSGGDTSTPTKTEDPKAEDPKPEQTKDPEPEETEQPKPPTTSGGWKSSAAQGEAAVAKALTLMGKPYKLGGSGPTYYDCSGLTMVSWKAAGLSIQRSSQMQYNSTKHVAFSQLRKGDLIFYGSDRNPSKIYHVAIYIGNGLVAEAARPGKDSLIRGYDESWRIDDLIPVAGRP
ncbi:NlpC/P60 family protein [Demequina sp.]|uniref:NlpC/P60 family protein n=1 Tax=Demequina sp. TaxID=2050685 RepID=UPI003D13DA68